MNDTVPTPARHGWSDLLRLVGAVRRLAYDRSLEPGDAMRHIRDAFDIYDGRFADEGDSDLAAGCAHLPNQIGHDRAEVG